jgi:hypothetical protein
MSRLRFEPRSSSACAPIASARPGMSLMGRSPVIQNSGAAASNTVAQSTARRASIPNSQFPTPKTPRCRDLTLPGSWELEVGS